MWHLLGLKNCDTCRKARQFLGEHAVEFTFIDYRETPPSLAQLTDWATQLGGADKLVNKASTTWRQLSDDSKQAHSDQDWLLLLQTHATLLKRPVLVAPSGQVTLGFNAAKWLDLIK